MILPHYLLNIQKMCEEYTRGSYIMIICERTIVYSHECLPLYYIAGLVLIHHTNDSIQIK